jgi:hypothetical protein
MAFTFLTHTLPCLKLQGISTPFPPHSPVLVNVAVHFNGFVNFLPLEINEARVGQTLRRTNKSKPQDIHLRYENSRKRLLDSNILLHTLNLVCVEITSASRTQTRSCTHKHTYTNSHTCTYTYTHAHSPTYTQLHTHAHTHTHNLTSYLRVHI